MIPADGGTETTNCDGDDMFLLSPRKIPISIIEVPPRGAIFLFALDRSDEGALVARVLKRIFLLTSLFIDSRFQTVATNDRCESMNNGKGE
jgi:hypothetical protein